ncbi:TPA: hypothetical protein ACH3X1_007177 [Trebouxia sp. C0004]
MSDLIFNIPSAFLTLGPVLARGANGVTLYKADLQQGQRSLQVAVKQFNISGASAAAERQFEKEVHIAQVASASCQRACRMLGCCKLDGNTCLVMSLYLSSAANRIEVLQGKAPLYHLKAKPAVMSGASQVELQEDVGTVKADIQQAKQDLRAAEATGDEKAVAFQRKQLEQLREKELILLRAQTAGPSDAWREEYKRDMAQLDTNLRALINRPSVISTTTLQELGALANKKPKVGVSLPDAHALAWDSPIWAQVTSSRVQLLEADKGQQKGLQSLFADLLPTAPICCPQPPSARHLCFMMCTRGPLFAAMI